jgi:hypothetical protein
MAEEGECRLLTPADTNAGKHRAVVNVVTMRNIPTPFTGFEQAVAKHCTIYHICDISVYFTCYQFTTACRTGLNHNETF